LGQLIGEHGFDESDFRWTETDGPYVSTYPKLTHGASGSHAIFGENRGDGGYGPRRARGPHDLTLIPGEQTATGDDHIGLIWNDVVEEVAGWLGRIKEDESAPSFWEALSAAGESVAPETISNADDPFGGEEVQLLIATLDQLADDLTVDLPEDPASQIRKEFEELRAEVTKLKKGRWITMAQGALVNLTMRLLIPREAASAAWESIVQVLKALGTIALPPAS
jgi:hypothetical protein